MRETVSEVNAREMLNQMVEQFEISSYDMHIVRSIY